MALSVIGSGFGRTGTRSLKDALELLGFGPCHHMEEVFPNPKQVDFWCAVARDEPVDWDEVFAGYGAQIDWPGAHVWRELAAAYPDARVIHSVRPPEAWWNSFSGTIGKFLAIYRGLPMPPHVAAMSAAVETIVGTQTFGGRATDKDHALAAYARREADVRAAIPAERLLVFDVAQGWAPLCAFLGVAVPDTPFPRTNSRDDFWVKFGGEPA
ncbi:sulfotransferase [Sphingomonas sp. RT2P30]|uniref:sulfotransferase family protein n=1 Tax=Parasphingomonas halimpatiens TaxID=3096162 RepID=UPI002FC6828A